MQATAELRPLGVGDIIDRVFAIYRSRPLMFLSIAAIPQVLLAIAQRAVTDRSGSTFTTLQRVIESGDPTAVSDALFGSIGPLMIYLVVIGVVSLAAALIQSASLVSAASALYRGNDTSVSTSLGVGLRTAPRLFATGLVAFVAVGVLWIAAVIAMAVTRAWWSVLVLGIIAPVATLFLLVSWMVSPAVATLEQASPLAALMRSWRLSSGSRWRILGLMVLLFVLEVVLSILFSFALVAAVAADPGVRATLQQAVGAIATIVWAPIYWGTFAVLYYDLRVRKEGLDLQLAAEALPRAT